MSITHKRFPTVGGNGKIIEPPKPSSSPRTFATVKSTPTPPVTTSVATKTFATAANVPPFDLDGTERMAPLAKGKAKPAEELSGNTTIPLLRRPSKPAQVVEKPKAKAKAKVTKSVTPLAKAKDPTEPVAKPTLAKRNPKVVPEVTAPIKATKADAKKIADVKKSVGPKAAKAIDAAVKVSATKSTLKKVIAKADKAVAKSAPVKKAVIELTAAKSTTAKPGKIADKKAYENAKKAGVITEVPKKIVNGTPAGSKAKASTPVLNKGAKSAPKKK
jgi:hypothetical protein